MGASRVGSPKVGEPNIPRFFFFLLSPIFSLSGGLLVELWVRVVAMDHPDCASGLLWGHFVSKGRRVSQNVSREAKRAICVKRGLEPWRGGSWGGASWGGGSRGRGSNLDETDF